MKLRFIKKLNNENNIELMQVFKTFLFGENNVELYYEGKIYQHRSLVIKYNPKIARHELFSCRVESSSESWVSDEWTKETSLGKSFRVEDSLIILSKAQPTEDENRLWYEEKTKYNDGKISVQTRLRDADNNYNLLFPKTITPDVYIDETMTKTLLEKILEDDVNFNRIKSYYLEDIMNILKQVQPLIANSNDLHLITTISPNEDTKITLEGGKVLNGSIYL